MMPVPQLWAVCFFIMIIMLGLDTQVETPTHTHTHVYMLMWCCVELIRHSPLPSL